MTMDCGTIADWANVIVAMAAVIIAGIALYHSHKIDKLNSTLLQRQTNTDFVYWHVHADADEERFVFRNIGTSTAHGVVAHIFIEGTRNIESGDLGDCDSGATVTMPSTKFLDGREGVVMQYYSMARWNKAAKKDTRPMTIWVLVEWKNGLGFMEQQEIPITYR